MDLPVFRRLVFASFVWGVGLLGATYVCAQDCGGGNGGGADQGSSSGDGGGAFGDTLDPNWDSIMTTWNFFAKFYDPGTGAPVVITVNANPSVYAGSPTVLSSSAGFADGPVIGHSIEYINADGSSGGVWTTDITYPFNVNPAANVDSFSINITYPSPGTYYVRGGISVLFRDGENPWLYSEQETVTVNDPMTHYTVAIQTHPKPGMEKWVLPSNVVTKNFQVFHSN
jgi:hypothetical protein